MFEKFSERCRQTVSVARQAALKLNQESIGTEHLLLGYLQVGGGVASKALKKLGADPSDIRREVENRLPPPLPGPERAGQVAFSPGSRQAIELAGEVASKLGHDTIGTEHLLLGLLRENEGIAAKALRAHGIEDAPLLAAILETIDPQEGPPPSSPPWTDSNWDLRRHAFGIKPLTDRPSIQEPLTTLLMQGHSIALVGPKRVGKTSVVLAMARSRAGSFTYQTPDLRMLDEFISPMVPRSLRPGTVCFIPQAELLTESRSADANLLEDRMRGGERLLLEFREGGLERFETRHPFIAKDLVKVEVKPPDADECVRLLIAARERFQELAGLQIQDDVVREADRLSRERCRLEVAPWPTIMILWAAESIQRETSARVNALSIESVRRAIGEFSGPAC